MDMNGNNLLWFFGGRAPMGPPPATQQEHAETGGHERCRLCGLSERSSEHLCRRHG